MSKPCKTTKSKKKLCKDLQEPTRLIEEGVTEFFVDGDLELTVQEMTEQDVTFRFGYVPVELSHLFTKCTGVDTDGDEDWDDDQNYEILRASLPDFLNILENIAALGRLQYRKR